MQQTLVPFQNIKIRLVALVALVALTEVVAIDENPRKIGVKTDFSPSRGFFAHFTWFETPVA